MRSFTSRACIRVRGVRLCAFSGRLCIIFGALRGHGRVTRCPSRIAITGVVILHPMLLVSR
jgi:hypothetical protein